MDLACGGIEEVIAPDDLGYLLSGVIDHDGELVGGKALFGPDDEVADRFCGVGTGRAVKLIFEGDGLVGDGESPIAGVGIGEGDVVGIRVGGVGIELGREDVGA